MLHLDTHIIPRFEQGMADISQNGHAPHVGTLIDYLRNLYGGQSLPTSDDFTRFLGELELIDLPHGLAPAVEERYRMIRRQLWDLCFEYPPVAAAFQDLPGNHVVDTGTAARIGDMSDAERHQFLEDLAQEYIGMMGVVSPDALATALQTRGEISHEERLRFVGALNRILQGSAPPPGGEGPGVYLNYDPDLLEMPTIREYVLRVLRRVAYRHLLEEHADTIEGRPLLFQHIRLAVEGAMHALAAEAGLPAGRILAHAPLFQEVINFYEDIVHLDLHEIPDLNFFVDTIQDHHGASHPFLSLRQLVAVRSLVPRYQQDEAAIARQYNCFRPGDGKTPIPFVVAELRNARRRAKGLPTETLIYILPTITTWDIANQVRNTGRGDPMRRFLRPESAQVPNLLGIIHSSVPSRDRPAVFGNALGCRYIICPISMLRSEFGERTILDNLLDIRHRTVAVDEAHETASSGGPHSKYVRRLFKGAGSRLLMSGTPAASGGLDGAVLCHELLVDPIQGQTSIDDVLHTNQKYERAVMEPIADIRARLKDTLVLDRPLDNMCHWHVEPLTVNSETEDAMLAVVEDDAMFWDKYHQVMIYARAPWLRDPQAQSAMLDRTMEIIQEQIQSRRVILVNEDEHTRGIFEPHPDVPDRPTFAQVLEQRINALNLGIGFEVLYGDLDDDERNDIRARMRRARAGTDNEGPLVVFANSKCVRTGMDLTSVELIIRLGPPFRFEILDQEFCRAFRAGHISPEMHLIYPTGAVPVEQLKWEISNAHHRITQRCFYGDIVTAAQLHEILQSEQALVNGGQLGYLLESVEQRSNSANRQLHNAGVVQVQAYWRTREELWRNMNIDSIDQSGLDSANQQRFLATLIRKLEDHQRVGCGPLMQIGTSGYSLPRHLHRIAPRHDREIINMEPSMGHEAPDFMNLHGMTALLEQGVPNLPRRLPGNALHLRNYLQNGDIQMDTIDCLVLENLDQYRWNAAGENVEFTQRAQALLYARRAAHTLVLTLPYQSLTQEEFRRLADHTLPLFGWRSLPQYTGLVLSQDGHGEPQWRNYCIVAERCPCEAPRQSDIVLTQQSLHFTHLDQWATVQRQAFANETTGSRLLPYPAIGTIFRLQEQLLQYDHPLPHQDIQAQHRLELLQAAALIRQAAPTVQAWHANRTTLEPMLAASPLQIVYANGQGNPGFFLRTYQRYTFYPYQAKWDPHTQ
jgi:hypothetical protein